LGSIEGDLGITTIEPKKEENLPNDEDKVDDVPQDLPPPIPTPTTHPKVNHKINPNPTPIPTPTPKILSEGERKVQEMLAKNRQAIAEQQGVKDASSGLSIVQGAKSANKGQVAQQQSNASSSNPKSLKDEYLEKLLANKKVVAKTRSEWQETIKKTYADWALKRQEFLKNLSTYKSNTFNLETSLGSSASNTKWKDNKKVNLSSKSSFISLGQDIVLIPGALDMPIQDQKGRPTCAAFAGIRAIETVIDAQHQTSANRIDLSEQYFYWLSKPKCQQERCSAAGSWVLDGFRLAQNLAIPTESQCPYNPEAVSNNDTQIPLTASCKSNGKVQVRQFNQLESLDEVAGQIKIHRPVIAGFKLTPNFYETTGVVTYQDSFKQGKLDKHAAGHALLIVGLIKLPSSMHDKEGQFCFLVSNSWSEGWGAGGHACLTEKWARTNLVPRALIALSEVEAL